MNLLQKAISVLGLEGWLASDVSRHDGTNFRTNTVTLADYQDSGAAGAAGVLALSAAWACVNLLAGTIASLPLMVYRTRNGSRTVASDHPLYRVLHDSPNADQTSLDFWEFICACLEMHGNAYCEIERGAGGRVIALSPPMVPELMQVRRLSNGDLEYEWTDGARRRKETQERILHIRGFGGSPLGGLSTLSFGRRAFGLAQAINNAAAATFRNGVRNSGVMTKEGTPFTAEQRKTAEDLLLQKYSGAMNAGVPMLLDNGLKWQSISINPEDAQMLESRAFSVEEICRFFGVPPHMVGHTEKVTSWGTGLEQQTLGFQKFTLRRRLKRIEQALEKQLLTPLDRSQGITIEFNLEGLLRADSKSRSEFYASGLQNGWFTINEVRSLENMPPVEGGDISRMQMQNQPITAAPALEDGQSPVRSAA